MVPTLVTVPLFALHLLTLPPFTVPRFTPTPSDTASSYASLAIRTLVERALRRRHALDSAVTDYAPRIGHGLSARRDSVPTGQSSHGIGYERLSDAFRYDRVQGYSVGLGYRVRLEGIDFDELQGTVRYGFSDQRVTGRLSLIRDAPSGRMALSAYHDVADIDPFSAGQTLGNTFNAIFTAHDNGDYALVTVGGSLSYETSISAGRDLSIWGKVEKQSSILRQAKSDVNDFLGGDGQFRENAPIADGTFAGLGARMSGAGRLDWWLAADGLAGAGTTTGRIYGQVKRSIGGKSGATVRAKAGIATAPTLPQMAFRLGGLETVRGFDYGAARGQAFWAAQLDVAPIPSRIRPVFFVDAGQAAKPSGLFSSKALVGAGVGLSLLRGALRFDLSRPLSPSDSKLRFDIIIAGVR
jgi:hypothetical protein